MRYKRNLVRTPAGIRLGDRVIVNGKKILHLTQNGKEDNLLPEQLVELLVGRTVKKIVYEEKTG